MDVIKSENCGNSPKNALVEEVAAALLGGDQGVLRQALLKGATWTRVGSTAVQGLEAILAATGAARFVEYQTARIEAALSHGRKGAVEFRLNRSGQPPVEGCLFVEFQGASGKQICALKTWGL